MSLADIMSRPVAFDLLGLLRTVVPDDVALSFPPLVCCLTDVVYAFQFLALMSASVGSRKGDRHFEYYC